MHRIPKTRKVPSVPRLPKRAPLGTRTHRHHILFLRPSEQSIRLRPMQNNNEIGPYEHTTREKTNYPIIPDSIEVTQFRSLLTVRLRNTTRPLNPVDREFLEHINFLIRRFVWVQVAKNILDIYSSAFSEKNPRPSVRTFVGISHTLRSALLHPHPIAPIPKSIFDSIES